MEEELNLLRQIAEKGKEMSRYLGHEVGCKFAHCTCPTAEKQVGVSIEFNRLYRKYEALKTQQQTSRCCN